MADEDDIFDIDRETGAVYVLRTMDTSKLPSWAGTPVSYWIRLHPQHKRTPFEEAYHMYEQRYTK